MPKRGRSGAHSRLSLHRPAGYGTYGAYGAGYRHHRRHSRRVDASDDCCDFGLTFGSASPAAMGGWLALQVVSLLLQYSLWLEGSSNLALYDHTVVTYCAPSHRRRGICIGPAWNVSAWASFALHGHPSCEHRIRSFTRYHGRGHDEFDTHSSRLRGFGLGCPLAGTSNYTFEFSTRSSPPTFMVVVEPVALGHIGSESPAAVEDVADLDEDVAATLADASSWTLRVSRSDPPITEGHVATTVRQEGGEGTVVVEDLSDEAKTASLRNGQVRWKAIIENRAFSMRQTRFVAFVEELSSSIDVGKFREASCSLIRSWRAFNEEHQGRQHYWASSSCYWLGMSLPVMAVAAFFVFLMRWRHLRLARSNPERNSGCGFHCIVIAKFFAVDILQQVCIVLYLLDWFEENGLRCQLCLFHPGHCDKPHPFHATTLGAVLCLLANSLSHQLLVKPSRPAGTKGDAVSHGEHAVQMQMFGRLIAACLAILPLTTSVYFASGALLDAPMLVKIVVTFPCAVGWFAVMCILCLWALACCRE